MDPDSEDTQQPSNLSNTAISIFPSTWRLKAGSSWRDWQVAPLLLLLSMKDPRMADEILVDSGAGEGGRLLARFSPSQRLI